MKKADHADLDRFVFRDVLPGLFMGTMSDRYSGWLGSIYSQNRYEGRITVRDKQIKEKRFKEEVLPVDSVVEYFEHFPVLEIDFTFYRTLLDSAGSPTSNFHVLKKYRENLQSGDRIVVKVPQVVFARKIRKGGAFSSNPDYLDPEIFVRRFYQPLVEILGDCLAGMIFEQEYQRKEPDSTPDNLAAEMGAFFSSIPADPRYHVEIRTPRLLKDEVFQVLSGHQVGWVLSHWTWLPSLRDQYGRDNLSLTSADGSRIIRLVTPRGMIYEESYAAAFPFDRMVEGMLHERVIEETVEIIKGEIKRGSQIYLFINNRAGGSAPLIARIIASRLLE